MFQHHYITQDMPGETDWGYGCPALADFDNDGDPDYAFSGAEGLFWYENMGNHELGDTQSRCNAIKSIRGYLI